MPAKNPEGRKHAIALRQRGMSVKEMAKALGHSPSSISLWVRDVVLTNKQKRALELRSPAGRTNTLNAKARTAASKSHRESARRARQEAQDRGALRVKEEGSGLFTAGCPLYWAGGPRAGTSWPSATATRT